MRGTTERGQVNLMAAFVVIALGVAMVWIWKRLSPDTQDYVIEQAVPMAMVGLIGLIVGWTIVAEIRARRQRRERRDRLKARFAREATPEKRRDIAFALIELNDYRLEGLEDIAAVLVDVLCVTLKTARGDKEHRTRGMAASYLGVLQDRRVIPLLMKALEDDHAHVRACAALGLGRLRAAEARDKLTVMTRDDWDQTVRSRAREALERLA